MSSLYTHWNISITVRVELKLCVGLMSPCKINIMEIKLKKEKENLKSYDKSKETYNDLILNIIKKKDQS